MRSNYIYDLRVGSFLVYYYLTLGTNYHTLTHVRSILVRTLSAPLLPPHLPISTLSSVSTFITTSPAHSALLYQFRTTFVPNPFPSISLHLNHLHVFTKKHPGYVLPARFLHGQRPSRQRQLSPFAASLTSHLLLTLLSTSLTKKSSASCSPFHFVAGSKSELETKSALSSFPFSIFQLRSLPTTGQISFPSAILLFHATFSHCSWWCLGHSR
jgi:hypothetical protein